MNLATNRSARNGSRAIVLLAATMLWSGAAHGAVLVGPIFDVYSNVNLYVITPNNWLQSQAEAVSLGGNLVTIQSSLENQFIVDNVLKDFSGSGGPNLSHVPAWIGLSDPVGAANDDGPGGPASQHAANFNWADGSSSAYRNWNVAEPNNGIGGEYYTAINWHHAANLGPIGTWNDTILGGSIFLPFFTDPHPDSFGPYAGIVAVGVPEPSTVVLTGVGLAALCVLAGRRRQQWN